MQDTRIGSNGWEGITHKDLVAMPIEQRKILARHIIEAGVLDTVAPQVPGWGIFHQLPPMDDVHCLLEARRIVSDMTLPQKIGQMTPNTTVAQYVPACLKYNDFPYIAGEDAALGIPGIRFTDGPAGVVMGRQSTCFPVAMARAATWDVELERRVGEAMGMEARALGANFFAGVCVNLLRHPSWGRSQETYGEDPHLLAAMGTAVIEGVQRHVMACVKHFALNSMENKRYKVNVGIDERSLREVYLPQFKACVDAGVAAVMSAYNKVRGEYCGENAYLLRTVLKGEWGFQGIVVSDFIHGLYDAVKAVKAGLDIEMPIEGHYGKNLLALVEQGRVPLDLIDQAAVRIVATKLRFSQRLQYDADYTTDVLACEAHVGLARQVALESAVLLKNEGGLLPLDKKALTSMVMLGRLADRPNIGEMKGSSHVYPPYVVTPLEGMLSSLADSPVTVHYFETMESPQARQAVAQADAVVVVAGLTSDDEGEYIPHWNSGCGGDRVELGLSVSDQALIAAATSLNDAVVVVMQGGGAILTSPWDHNVGAILMTWYPGMEGGHALASILFGEYNPSGKLPLTLAASAEQLPPFDKDAEEVTYGYFHGYFKVDHDQAKVSYPFGFGLSYTTFTYGGAELEEDVLSSQGTLRVRVTVANTGTCSGSEVVQLYIGCATSAVARHVKELKAFCRIMLQAGESRTVELSVPVNRLAYWDENISDWTIEKTSYLAYVGSSSAVHDVTVLPFEVR